ncbi:hypothetical protein SASPL_111336 [Salvia splendens]|uniref:Glycosyltransferase N-terminal domain-containing protein n=1 Tax=Salvia splendens TaxID=180675 RepID=A0A8X8YCA4_SALSN|nr:hypothetical protein SASPL_111336 [Salvia splendens]
MEKAKTEAAVLMVPLPCQSHLNQLLQLSGVISSCGIPVHFVGNATHNRQVRLRSPGLKLDAIHFHDLPTPPIGGPSPDPHAADKVPMHLAPATLAYAGLREQIGLLAQKLSQAGRRLRQDGARGGARGGGGPQRRVLLLQLPLGVQSVSHPVGGDGEAIPTARRHAREASFQISGGKKQWAIRSRGFSLERESSDEYCLKWLDRQPPKSVIYVSFGTTTSFRDEEYAEIAMGLEESGQRFVWVVREADRADIFAGGDEGRRIKLREGFEERGIVVRGWDGRRRWRFWGTCRRGGL